MFKTNHTIVGQHVVEMRKHHTIVGQQHCMLPPLLKIATGNILHMDTVSTVWPTPVSDGSNPFSGEVLPYPFSGEVLPYPFSGGSATLPQLP